MAIYLHKLGQPLTTIPAEENGGSKFDRQPAIRICKVSTRADGPTLDRIYQTILDNLPLSDVHLEVLKGRGLTESAIVDRGYRSYPRTGRAAIAKRLSAELGEAFTTIPGLVVSEGRPKLVGPQGILVPCRDLDGRIVALKVRRDEATSTSKYMYVSSTRHGGPGPGAPVHVPLGVGHPIQSVWLTEGELKADVATVLSGIPTISIPGAAHWQKSIQVMRALGVQTVRLSFDADANTNRVVAKSLLDSSAALTAEGLDVELERWDRSLAKGIDDLLTAGRQPELLAGESAVAAIKEIAHGAGVNEIASSQTQIIAQLESTICASGPAALFGNQSLLGDLAAVAVTDAAQWAMIREYLRSAGVRLRELDCVLRPLMQRARAERPAIAPMETDTYFVSETGYICRQKPTFDGSVSVALANFQARIVQQITHDDGVERRTVLAIEGALPDGRRLQRVEIPAEEFARMNWPVSAWGTAAVVSAGLSARDHLRAAVQILSGEVPRLNVYTHTGWRQINEQWFYLHAGGAIGPNGVDRTVSVSLPEALTGYHLSKLAEPSALAEAVRSSLRLVEVASPAIIFPILAAIYRAVLGNTDHSLHLVGPTGVFKSELAALAQQHFGPTLDARHFPGSWTSTGNALEATAFGAKDAILSSG